MTEDKGGGRHAVEAAKAESNGSKELVYEFKGTEFVFPPSIKMASIDAMEAAEDGKTIAFLRELMGAEQWRRFKELGAKYEDLEAIDAWFGSSYGGFKSVGESSASGAS